MGFEKKIKIKTKLGKIINKKNIYKIKKSQVLAKLVFLYIKNYC